MICQDVVGPVAQKLATCVSDHLAMCGYPVRQASLVPGLTSPADVCCAGDDADPGDGMAWVAVGPITATKPDGATGACGYMYEATITVGLYRCAPTLDVNGDPPTPQELEDAALANLRDAAIVRQAIGCCWPRAVPLDPSDWDMGTWTPYGPEGGCMGGTHLVTLYFADCACLDG